ncbi:MAG TPA: PhzF family phenazine biosynthesis isomerase, partial [Chryseosolibacter sp.]
MKKNRIYQVDAFTENLFSGNPAAVCPLEGWMDDDTMQSIAAENNLAETAFFIPAGDHFEIRWFTPTVEVDLCGHATLASAFVLFNYLGHSKNEIR